MTYGIFAIKDAKTAFMPCTVDYNNDSAIRNFEHAVRSPDSLMSSHPGDYALYRLGTYDTDSGMITVDDLPVQIADAAAIVRK